MILEEMDNEQLVDDLIDAHILGHPLFRSSDVLKTEILSRLTRGEKAIKAMEDLQCCGNCCYIADRRCPKWYTGMLTEATNFFRSFAKWVKENENKDDNFPCLGDCIHINETVICKKCGPDNYLYVPHETDED